MRWKIIVKRDGTCELWSRGVLVAIDPCVIALFELVTNSQQLVPA